MSVCNLFKKLNASNNGQGFFFTFSQYAEDLTKENSLQSDYRVIPSKFACLNLNEDSEDEADNMNTIITDWNTMSPTIGSGDPNYALPQMLMAYYENAVSHLREEPDGFDWSVNNFDASAFLWNALLKKNLVTLSTDTVGEVTYHYIPELKYIGDTNIYSNENVQAINYNEIYCMVPADAKCYRYPVELTYDTSGDYTVHTKTPATQGYNIKLNGWDSVTTSPNFPGAASGLLNKSIFDSPTGTSTASAFKYHVGDTSLSTSSTFVVPSLLSTSTNPQEGYAQTDASFNFNTIILFYDVWNGESVLYKNLPLGIWFSGDIFVPTGSTQKLLRNAVTKFVSTDSAFDQGTSYGLRICTKYVATPFGTSVVSETLSMDDLYPEFSTMCGAFADSIVSMNHIAQTASTQHSQLVNYLSQFTNRRTNIPYTVAIPQGGNVYYWFVNGRNTGVVAGVDATALQALQQRVTTLETTIATLQQ